MELNWGWVPQGSLVHLSAAPSLPSLSSGDASQSWFAAIGLESRGHSQRVCPKTCNYKLTSFSPPCLLSHVWLHGEFCRQASMNDWTEKKQTCYAPEERFPVVSPPLVPVLTPSEPRAASVWPNISQSPTDLMQCDRHRQRVMVSLFFHIGGVRRHSAHPKGKKK